MKDEDLLHAEVIPDISKIKSDIEKELFFSLLNDSFLQEFNPSYGD